MNQQANTWCCTCGWRHTVPCGRDECPFDKLLDGPAGELSVPLQGMNGEKSHVETQPTRSTESTGVYPTAIHYEATMDPHNDFDKHDRAPSQDCGRLGHLFGTTGNCIFCGLPGPAGLDCRSLHRRLGLMAEAMVSAKVGPQARFFTRERVDEIVLLLREAEKHVMKHK